MTAELDKIIAEMRAVPATVPYDKLLNDLGWEMNSFLTNNGATFDGRVFNNMKGFIKQMIEKWVALSSDPALLDALSEATSRAEALEAVIEQLHGPLSIASLTARAEAAEAEADSMANELDSFRSSFKEQLDFRDRATKAEAERDAAVAKLNSGLTAAEEDVIKERSRQVVEEGWDAAHDDEHSNDEMAMAAACYALNDTANWPWSMGWWKPSTNRRNLVKAGALIIAEIERLDRRARSITAKEPT